MTSDPVVELVVWLRQALDEDETIARAAAAEGGPDWAPDATFLADLIDPLPSQRRAHPERLFLLTPKDAEHIARHDPARVLREISAKRAIIDQCVHTLEYEDYGYTIAEFVLRSLGAALDDHPGYRAEWRPR